MRLAFAVIFLVLLAALCVCTVLAAHSKKAIGKYVAHLTGCTLPPITGNLILLLTTNSNVAMFGFYLYFLGVDIMIYSVLRFSYAYCEIKPPKHIRRIQDILIILDALQYAFNPLTGLTFSVKAEMVEGFRYFESVPFIGQEIHRIVIYGIFTAVIFVFVYKGIKTPKINAEKYWIILFAMLGAVVLKTYDIFSKAPLDFSMMAFGAFGILVYYFSLHYRPMKLLDKMLSGMASEMPDALFFFDKSGTCVWTNEPGRKLLGGARNDYESVKDNLTFLFGDIDFDKTGWSKKLTLGTGDETQYTRLEMRSVNDEYGKNTGSSAEGDQKKDQSAQKKAWKDPIYFMEKQANRGASALMMPASDTRSRILDESIKAQETIRKTMGRPSRHLGELYEEVGKQLSKKLGVPHFRIRARFIQLGYVEAKGSLNYVEKKLIQPFAFEPDSWQEPTHTFNIDRRTLQNLMIANEDLRKVMESKRYVYADGHVVRNGSRFLELKKDWMGLDNLVLSDWANRHVDECCLRFVRVYMQEGIGQYVFGRMYYDAEFVARTRFYIDDFLNREKIGDIDDIEARMLYKQRFPKKFAEAFQFLRVANGTKMIEMADALGLTEQQLRRWLDMPTKYRNEDFLTAVALVLELPDWISRLLFKRAGLVLDDENARHVALDHILRAQSCDGIPAANSYLERHNLSALTY